MILPIHLASPAKDFPPHSYVVHKYSQHCRCGRLHESSKVYAKTHLKARTATVGSRYVTNLRPVTDPTQVLYNLPIEIISMPLEKLLFCHDCITQDTLSHLPPPPAHTEVATAPELRNIPLVKNATPPRTRYWTGKGKDQTERYEDTSAGKGRPKAAKPPTKYTIDDL